ncbi:MAG: hypothetical protein IPK77_10655 [Cellvibrio sp.]|nr:hypothetical protein [Cellvibrio sp.]
MEVTAKGKTFTFPDGTDPELIGDAIDEYFAAASISPEIESKYPYPQKPQTMADVPVTGFNGEMIPVTPADPYEEPVVPYEPTGIDAAIGSTPVIGGAYEYAKTLVPDPAKRFISSAVAGGADVLQTGGALLSGIGSDILGKVTAIPYAYGGDESPEDVYQRVVEANQYIPSRAGARANLQTIGSLLQPLESLPPVIGVGMPQMNAIARSAAMRPELPQDVTPSKSMQEALDINRGSENKALAGKMTTAQAPMKPVTDPIARKVMDIGLTDKFVQSVKSSSAADKKKFTQMLDVLGKSQDELIYGKFNHPSDVVGDSLKERITYVKNTNRQAGTEIDRAALNLKDKTVDYSGSVSGFINDLQNMGVSLDTNKRPAFKGSDVEGFASDEKIISQVLGRLNDLGDNAKAYDVHRLKRYIDRNVLFGSSALEKADPRTVKIMRDLRERIDADLDGKFKDYDAANTKNSKTIRSLDALQKNAGSVDILSDEADRFLGARARAIMSNQQRAGSLEKAIKDIDDTAKEFGFKSDEDIIRQIGIVDELEKVFNVKRSTSLGGEMDKAAETLKSLRQKGTTETAIDFAFDPITKKFRKTEDQRKKEAIETMRKLLTRGEK